MLFNAFLLIPCTKYCNENNSPIVSKGHLYNIQYILDKFIF